MFIDDLEHISFAEWLVELNASAVRAGYQTELPFVQITGQLEWHTYYEEGLSPDAAIEAAAKAGLQFGRDYDDETITLNP